eukprot:GFYU01002230.1.p1 GENE.GFYU01002230.1~~GFYU01002230.1.p1  ORF type:complete len:363 (+),score=107.23 GFYU01002230.1:32-1090(+)
MVAPKLQETHVEKEGILEPKNKQEWDVHGSTTPVKFKDGDFQWSYTDEPHFSRRKAILTRYPEVKELYGPDIMTLPKVLAVVSLQLAIATYISQTDLAWTYIIPIAWVVGGTCSQILSLALHELSHNLCFETKIYNKILGFTANLPMAIPAFVTFTRYHMEHHTLQGTDVIDTDIPSEWEGRVFVGAPMKLLWVFLQPFFYGLRPIMTNPKKPVLMEMVNQVCVVAFDLAIYTILGQKALLYFLLSTFLGLGLHPISGHFIAEHYTFVPGQETYSYYGPLNHLTFYVGYHNEHHDFPRIPGSRLYRLREIAPEFYQMKSYSSWPMVIWDFVMDPEMTPFSRVKRERKSKKEH